jgi:L-asparaginase II
MQTHQLDVLVTRGNSVESRHRVHAAIVSGSGVLRGKAGDPGLVTPWRSCAKPFQIMPFLEAGGFEELEWGDDELALACGSHGGEPEHVAIAESMLKDIGLEEGDLACGVHEPLSKRGAKLVRDSGAGPTRLHNNCSGKHAAMLARAHLQQWPTAGYERGSHPVQEGCLAAVAKWTGVPADRIPCAVDGCGVPVFVLSLEAMARAYAALACGWTTRHELPRRVGDAMLTRPFLVGGSDRFDTILMEASEGKILSKIGAEGVQCAALMDEGWGIAIKVEDGSPRAQYPALLHLLQQLTSMPEPLPARLEEYARTRVRNTRGEIVGEVRVAEP